MFFESPRVPRQHAADHGEVTTKIQVITLGQFTVRRNGVDIPHPDWQSRKARNLFKLLVCRHGRSVPREVAVELLWPEQPGPPGNRFSVALSTARKVLDPDHLLPADHFLAADDGAVRLRTEHVDIDIATFLQLARDARIAVSRGDWDRADGMLRSAERLYAGDFLEEDQYADWVAPYREEARSAALGVLRLLAEASRCRDDSFATVAHLQRLLEIDPYDEAAWLDLIAVESTHRHHGEARRLHTIYVLRMLEIGVVAAPLPAVSMLGPEPNGTQVSADLRP